MSDTTPVLRTADLIAKKHEGTRVLLAAHLGRLLLGDKLDFEIAQIRVLEGFWHYIKKSKKKGGLGGVIFGGSSGGGKVPGVLLMAFNDPLITRKLKIYPVHRDPLPGNPIDANDLIFDDDVKDKWQFLQDIIPDKPCHVRDSGEIILVLEVECKDPPKPPFPGYVGVEKSGGGTLPALAKISVKITRR